MPVVEVSWRAHEVRGKRTGIVMVGDKHELVQGRKIVIKCGGVITTTSGGGALGGEEKG